MTARRETAKIRLDQHLQALGYFDSRAQAAAAIKAGQVFINGQPARKASQTVSMHDRIDAQAAHGFVSRGGLKLDKALTHFAYPVAGKTIVDVGASTGGFCDVLLKKDAKHIYALDVGQGQLHEKIAADARVANMEKHNARAAMADWFEVAPEALVCDVSFISVKLALDHLLSLTAPQAWAIILVKPQFEVGRSGLGKNGVVSDGARREKVCVDIKEWVEAHAAGWCVDDIIESPITGPQGNVEYLLGAHKRPASA